MNRINIAAAGFALAATALIVPAAVFAQDAPITVQADPERVTTWVSYGDLNMSSPAGLDTLRSRVRGAAERICIHDGVEPLKFEMDGRRCYREAVAGAETQIGQVLASLDRGERYASNARIAVSGARLQP